MSHESKVKYKLGLNFSEGEDIINLVENSNFRFSIAYKTGNRDSSVEIYDGYKRVDYENGGLERDLVDILDDNSFGF